MGKLIKKFEREVVKRVEKLADLEKYIQQENGKIVSVDWQAIVNLRKNLGRNDLHDNFLLYLHAKGVLSYPVEGTFFPIGEGMDLSPMLTYCGVKFHFTNEEDAKKYGQADHGRARYSVHVAKRVSKVPKEKD